VSRMESVSSILASCADSREEVHLWAQRGKVASNKTPWEGVRSPYLVGGTQAMVVRDAGHLWFL
jgi:hypothetical protein